MKQNQMIKTALLVEDNAICQLITKEQLFKLDYEVDTADDAATAINKLKEKSYCLIVTDLRLPDKPGTEVIKAARLSTLNQAAPLIVCSAQLSESEFETYLDLGADAVLIKPYFYEKLAETIKNCYLTPGYQRKLFYQLCAWQEEFQQELKLPQTHEEILDLIEYIKVSLNRALSILQEYQQWSEFEKIHAEINT